jgi:hypothetical protein
LVRVGYVARWNSYVGRWDFAYFFLTVNEFYAAMLVYVMDIMNVYIFRQIWQVWRASAQIQSVEMAVDVYKPYVLGVITAFIQAAFIGAVYKIAEIVCPAVLSQPAAAINPFGSICIGVCVAVRFICDTFSDIIIGKPVHRRIHAGMHPRALLAAELA